MKQNRAMLGIVFYERTIAVSEVENSGGSIRVCRSAEFNRPDQTVDENLASLQAPFEDFVRQQGFKAKKAVVGISSNYVLSTLLKIPPIQDSRIRHETIKIQLERKLEVELADMVFDCWDGNGKNRETTLVLAALRKTIEPINSFLRSLKITPLSVTAASLGLDFGAAAGLDCNMVEYPHSVECFLCENGDLKAILTVAKKTGAEVNDALAGEIVRQVHRTLLSLSVKEDTVNYYWWTNERESAKRAAAFTRILGSCKQIEIKGEGQSASMGNLCDFSARLAGKVLTAEPASVNFLNGHHQEKKPLLTRQRLSMIAVWGGGILLLIGLYFYGWYSDHHAIVRCQRQLDSMKEDVQAARQMVDQVGFARQWFLRQPTHLDMLRELTLAFPQSSDIWLTSLAVDESLNQIITGRAVTEDAILDLVDTLKASPLFEDIKLLFIRKMGKNTEVLTFAVNLHFRGEQ